MKVIIFTALFAGLSFACPQTVQYPQTSFSFQPINRYPVDVAALESPFAAQLPALANVVNSFEDMASALSVVTALISETGDLSLVLNNLDYQIPAFEAVVNAVSTLSAVISSGAPLGIVNDAFENLAQSEQTLVVVATAVGTIGSYSQFSYFVSVKQSLAVAVSGFTAVINSLPSDVAAAFGQASILYGFTSALNTLANAKSNYAATINAFADNSSPGSVLKSFASATYQESAVDFDLAAALVNAAFNV